MNYNILERDLAEPSIAFLCPVINLAEVDRHYVSGKLDAIKENIMVCELYLNPHKKKTPAAEIKEYLNDLIPILMDRGIKLLVVTQPDYFKILTKQGKTDVTIGDVMDSIVGPDLKVTYCPNYARVFYDPDKMNSRIAQAMDAVTRWAVGDVAPIGEDIIRFAAYPKTTENILSWLDKLYQMDCPLTVDIEGFSLKHYDAGVGTITFCWSEHEGVAFAIDFEEIEEKDGHFGRQVKNEIVRNALRIFFERSNQKMIYHNICYDVYVLVYQLFMDHILDQEGLLYGLSVLLKNWDCTQIISYLATNSCAGNELGLKTQAQEFAGNYAVEEIKDIRKIPLPTLLKYNLIDGLSTWYVYNKNMPIAIQDDQMTPYNDLFRPAVIDIIQMQLTGMPINMKKVVALNKQLTRESDELLAKMSNMRLVRSFVEHLEDVALVKKNGKLKTKVVTRADLGSTNDLRVSFNPNSSVQLQQLLYSESFLGLPVLDYTDSKLPATGADTLEKLKNHVPDGSEVQQFLDVLIEFKASAIILSTFLPAFLLAQKGNDGWHYLFGNFRLGGTASGRLSSNNPNLQNIPSSGASAVKRRLAKLIKECFEAPPGWLFVGLDFDSLEDKISAVTTQDPEKIKVYSDGYDGHCLRALAYFQKDIGDIELCPEGATAYKAVIEGKEIYFHSYEEIEYKGQKLLGHELFAQLNK